MAGPLAVGDPLPWFACRTHQSDGYQIETAAGRPVVLFAFGAAGAAPTRAALAQILERRDRFAALGALVAGVSADPACPEARAFSEAMVAPVFLDADLALSRQLGVVAPGADGRPSSYRPTAFVLDRQLRVAAALPLEADAPFGARLLDAATSVAARDAGFDVPAPVLVIPDVFEPAFRARLMDHYDSRGGEPSGFMRTDKNGRTVHAFDPHHKVRRDRIVEDEGLKAEIRARLSRRVVPAIKRAFQFDATRIERYLVACYAADEGGHFRAHRDNTTKGTAHRRFAVSINLDAARHEGGDLRFPEFGRRTYRPPSGGAVVFSCSLQHEATPVTAGRRYCVLPFLYDDAAAKVREANLAFIVEAGPTAAATA